jgi:hypothetical protein
MCIDCQVDVAVEPTCEKTPPLCKRCLEIYDIQIIIATLVRCQVKDYRLFSSVVEWIKERYPKAYYFRITFREDEFDDFEFDHVRKHECDFHPYEYVVIRIPGEQNDAFAWCPDCHVVSTNIVRHLFDSW